MARTPRLLRSLAATVALLVLVGGVPAALWRLGGGWPLPHAMPVWSHVVRALRQGDLSATVAVRGLAAVLWVIWLQVAWAIVWEVAVNVPRHQRAARPRSAPVVAAPIGHGVARLVSAALMVGLVGAQSPAAALVARAPTAGATPSGRAAVVNVANRTASVGSASSRSGSPQSSANRGARNLRSTATPLGAADLGSGTTGGWRVTRGESLWSIAEQALGDGGRFHEILGLNPFLSGPRDVRTGQELMLPADARIPTGRQASLVAPATVTPADGESPTPRHVDAATVEVAPGDTLWDLSRAHLAADAAAPAAPSPAEIADHLVQVVAVNDIPSGDPGLIHPGERFRLPAVGLAPPVAPTAAPAVSPIALDPRVDESSPPPAPVPVSRADNPTPAKTTEPAPSVGGPGSSRALPADRVGTNGDGLDAPLTAPVGRPDPAAASRDVVVRLVDAVEPAPAASLLPAGLAGATLLATGAAGLLASRRRRRLRGTGPRQALMPADPDLASAETAIHVAADPQGLARLDASLRALAAGVDPSAGRPQLVIRRAGGEIEVWLTAALAGAPPSPWTIGADARCLVLPTAAPLPVLAAAARGVPSPCPALVLLGRAGPDEVYIDLEAAGAIVLDGSPAVVTAVARALIASLALSPLADVVDLVTCGVDCYGFTEQRRVHTTASTGEAIQLANRLVDATRRQLVASALPGTFTLRASRREEPWEPAVVVVVRSNLDRAQLTELDDLAAGGGAAVITDRPLPGASWHLTATAPGRWRLDPLGLELQAIGLAADELADLGALLADADADAGPALADAELANGSTSGDSPAADRAADRATDPADDPGHAGLRLSARSASPGGAQDEHAPAGRAAVGSTPAGATGVGGAYVERPWSLLVRVLGPVGVVDGAGAPVPFERAKALELVVWLAQHRGNPNRMNARTALWQTDVRDATFLNVVSDARRALARLVDPPNGEEWIGRSGGERLPLHPLVVSDAELLAARLAHARRQAPADAIETLSLGLEMVGGAPLDGVAYLWPDAEGVPSALTHLVTSAATELAEHHLAVGTLGGALWATGQGLLALPGHEELVCLRMRAQHRAGSHAGVRAEFESYERVITNDDWGDGEPAPGVVALRNELLGQRSA